MKLAASVPVRSPLQGFLDQSEKSGRLNLRTQEIAEALPRLTSSALDQALNRQRRRGRLVRLSRGAGHWLIVPLQHAESGAPPLEIWLDPYLRKTLGLSYYVGLLSAAEVYGASPYAVMVTQVMVPAPRRTIQVGRHTIKFHKQGSLESLPTRWHETPDGRFKVSTPELTALDLIRHSRTVGGMARVRDVLLALGSRLSDAGITQALDAAGEITTAQRFGALLASEGQAEFAATVAHWLNAKGTRVISLDPHADSGLAQTLDNRFKVWIPSNLRSANA